MSIRTYGYANGYGYADVYGNAYGHGFGYGSEKVPPGNPCAPFYVIVSYGLSM